MRIASSTHTKRNILYHLTFAPKTPFREKYIDEPMTKANALANRGIMGLYEIHCLPKLTYQFIENEHPMNNQPRDND